MFPFFCGFRPPPVPFLHKKPKSNFIGGSKTGWNGGKVVIVILCQNYWPMKHFCEEMHAKIRCGVNMQKPDWTKIKNSPMAKGWNINFSIITIPIRTFATGYNWMLYTLGNKKMQKTKVWPRKGCFRKWINSLENNTTIQNSIHMSSMWRDSL